MDPALWDQTVEISVSEGILSAPPTEGAYITDIAEEAVANLEEQGVDVVGAGWTSKTIELKEGGN
jgi:NitT/TauT family transport system substrate-binding protein